MRLVPYDFVRYYPLTYPIGEELLRPFPVVFTPQKSQILVNLRQLFLSYEEWGGGNISISMATRALVCSRVQ